MSEPWYKSSAAPFVRRSGKSWQSLIFLGRFGIGWLFCTACPRVVALTARRCIHHYRAFRSVHAALQTATAVVSIHELAWCRNAGNSMLQWGIYPRPCLLNLRNNFLSCAPSSSRIFYRGRRRVSKAYFPFFL